MRLTVDDLLKVRHVEFHHRELLEKRKITGISTDTRSLKSGDLFFALKGENFDGHAFVESAFEKGASVAVVEGSFERARYISGPLLVVENATRALGELAHLYRQRFSIPIIAIGGSNGKTTTKDMIADVLKTSYNVLSTSGNHNNHIGVPLTLFHLEKKHDVAVVEVGTNHPGEIEYLVSLLNPTDGLITNIGHEHLEFFKSLDGVAEEEGKLFQQLKLRKRSRLFVNADDARVKAMAGRARNRWTFGFAVRAVDVAGRVTGVDKRGSARLEFRSKNMKRSVSVQLQVPGRHNAANALAAAAVGLAFDVPPTRIRKALEDFCPPDKRMEALSVGGVTIYNDTYNANPDSMVAALQTLAAARVTGKRIAVLADMRELGESGPEEHARVGREATKLRLGYLLTFGELAKHIHDAAGVSAAIHYDQKNVLAEYLAELVAPGDAVLVKGSRGMKMEDVVTFLVERLRHASAELPG
jgi:UDP-N-acetylmuramoyl-tripeptide--D-alanyl-D-alanine ligase